MHLHPFHWREAALCVPAMPLLVIGFALAGRPTFGALAAGAAFSVGFGAAREMATRRWGAMLLSMLGMTAAAFSGTLLGQEALLFTAVAAMLAAACAALALHDEDA
jgi:hypothetical protein